MYLKEDCISFGSIEDADTILRPNRTGLEAKVDRLTRIM